MEPLNVTVMEGETAMFECSYTGVEEIIWIINDFYYSDLPDRHYVYESQPNVLVITGVQLSMNGSSYRCYAEAMLSTNTGHLYVELRPAQLQGKL